MTNKKVRSRLPQDPGSLPDHESDLTSRLITRFRDLVADGTFTPGSRLPPERTLAGRFGVNRTSLRHALTALETMGIVSRRVGDGTYLSSDSRTMLSAPMDFLVLVEGISFHDLMEARIILEPTLAARAAIRSDALHLAKIREAVERMEASEGDLQELVDADVAFHEAVAAASGNVTCQRMFGAIHQTLTRLITKNAQSKQYHRKAARHHTIYLAIRRREPEIAAERMRSHLEDALKMFVRESQEQVDRTREEILPKKLLPIGRA